MALRLTDRGHSVSIVDKNQRAFRRLPEDWPGDRIVGSGFDREALDAAGAPRAVALAAVTSGDNSNILTARIARETYEIPRVVARIYDPRRAEIYLRLGIPTVATVTWTIDRVLQRVLPDAVAAEWTDGTGKLMLLERLLPDHWAGLPVRETVQNASGRLVAVTRAGEPHIDVDPLFGQEGDVLHIAVTDDRVGLLEARMAPGTGQQDRPLTDPRGASS
jgi:trk system potassium uptake protein